jgi:hypothetical protein
MVNECRVFLRQSTQRTHEVWKNHGSEVQIACGKLPSCRGAGVYDVYSCRSVKWREVICRCTTRLTSSSLQLYTDTVYPYAYPIIPKLRPHFLRLQQRHPPPNSPFAFLDSWHKTRSYPSQFHAHDPLPRKLLSHRRIQKDVAPRAED